MSIVFVISAPSGSGKSTLVRRLLQQDSCIKFSVSYTTRQLRGQEEEGQDYHYLSREQFEADIAAGEFLEYAEVFGNYYGTHRRIIDQARAEGKDILLDIDVQGARQLKSRVPDAVTVFVLAPSREELEQRLKARSEDSEAVIAKRLRGAAREIGNYERYDYVLVNRDLEQSVDTLASIVKAERVRRARMEAEVASILATFGKEG
ncbi:MAG TPA: guanylate kinase [Bryobacteraceae bacterium]